MEGERGREKEKETFALSDSSSLFGTTFRLVQKARRWRGESLAVRENHFTICPIVSADLDSQYRASCVSPAHEIRQSAVIDRIL